MKALILSDDSSYNGSLIKTIIDSFKINNVETVYIYPKLNDVNNTESFRVRVLNRISIIFRLKEKNLTKRIKDLDINTFDFVLVLKGRYLNKNTFKLFKDKPVFCFNPDDPYNNINSNKNIRDCLPLYQTYFIWSKYLLKKIEKKENIRTYYIPFAADLTIHRLSKKVEKKYPISFIGNWDEERESWLASIEEVDKLFIFGVNWKRKCNNQKLKDRFFDAKHLNEFSETAKTSIININVLRKQNKNSNNMRTFEILASKGFLLHEYSDEVAKIFIEGKEIEFFRDLDELNEKIDYYLKNPDDAQCIAENGYKKIVQDKHTYNNRVKEMLSIIKEYIK